MKGNILFLFWWRWLIVVTVGVILFGLSMFLAPGLTRQFFSLLFFSSYDRIDALVDPAVAYITLLHAVLGSVIFGWGIAFLSILLGPFRRGSYEGWLIFAVSLIAWFVPDTAFSLWSGFWQNAVLNTIFIVLFAIPLSATYRWCRQQGCT